MIRVLAFVLFAVPSFGWAVVSAEGVATSFGGSPASHSIGLTVNSGDTLVLVIHNTAGWTGISVSDDASNSYSADYTTTTSVPVLFYRATVGSVPTSISVTFTGSNGSARGALFAITDTLDASPVGQTNEVETTAAESSVSTTTATNNEIAIGSSWKSPGSGVTGVGIGVTAASNSTLNDYFYSDDLGTAQTQNIGVDRGSSQFGSQGLGVVTYILATGGGSVIPVLHHQLRNQ